MKAKLLFATLCLAPTIAGASIPYRVEQIKTPTESVKYGKDSEALARTRRFYVGGGYNFAMWLNYTDENNIHIAGKNTSGFEGMLGLRIYDTFRIEANYLRTAAEWNTLSFSGDTVFLNAIFDARIDNIYRLFHTQMWVPYVGMGAGLSWNSANDGIKMDKKISPVVGAMAGISVEFNTVFSLDFGYRYFYMFNPEIDGISDFNPTSHQFRAGARISF